VGRTFARDALRAFIAQSTHIGTVAVDGNREA